MKGKSGSACGSASHMSTETFNSLCLLIILRFVAQAATGHYAIFISLLGFAVDS